VYRVGFLSTKRRREIGSQWHLELFSLFEQQQWIVK